MPEEITRSGQITRSLQLVRSIIPRKRSFSLRDHKTKLTTETTVTASSTKPPDRQTMSSPQARPGDSSPQPQHHPSHAAEQRVRKRRRRTMACTQCRSRKIRCDREYPICGRCQKSKTPANCTYEDGYVWQMPNTVSVSSSALPDRGSTGPNTPPDSALTNHHQQRPRQPLPTTAAVAGSIGGEKRDCFLETVLGAPKSVDRGQGSGVNSDLRQRVGTGGRSGNVGSIDDDGDGDDGLRASPSRQLDLSPKILMRGKETKTRFNGSGIFANLMAQVMIARRSSSHSGDADRSSSHISNHSRKKSDCLIRISRDFNPNWRESSAGSGSRSP